MTDPGTGLTSGRVTSLVRVCVVLSLLLIGAAIALQFAPLQRPPSPSDLINATSRQGGFTEEVMFPNFGAKLGTRDNPFQFEKMNRAQVQFQQVAPPPTETPVTPPPEPPPPVPQPDIDGLVLVGTVPGSRHGFALLLDDQSGQVQTIAIGEAVRNATLSSVHRDYVELTLADQSAELRLAVLSDAPASTAGSQVNASPQAQQVSPAPPPPRRGGKPSLGLSGYMLSPSAAQQIGVSNGLLVSGVRRADGLVQVDDVIVKLDGSEFSSTREVVNKVKGKSPGDQIELTLIRKSRSLIVTIVL